MEVAAQVVAGLGGPERAVLHAFLGTANANASARRIAVAGSSHPGNRVPAEGRGDAADVLRVEHVHPAVLGAHRGGQAVDVGLGGGGDDRAGVAQDDVGQERRLVGPWRGHDEQVLFQRDPQAVPVVGPAEEYRVLVRSGDPVPQRERGADPAGAAQRREAAPAQPQAEDVGEALAGVQPKVEADPQVAGAVAGQVAGGQERPRERCGKQDHDEQGDGVLGDHEGSPLRADRTALRRAARAAPGFRPTAGARAALIAATRSRGMEARGPCRSVTKERNRAVLVAFRGTVPLPRPGRACGRAAGGAAAGGDRALLEDPGAEPGQGRGRRQGQAQQPQDQAAEHGERGGRVGQRGGQLLVAGRAQARTTPMRVSLARA